MLKIRITAGYEFLHVPPITIKGKEVHRSFIEKLRDACDVLVVYEHEPDDSVSRLHVHAYVEGLSVSTDTLKNWVKIALGVTAFPKTDWSFTEARDRGFITYMSNGHLTPKFVKGISDDEIKSLKAEWVDTPKPVKGKMTQYILKQENPAQQKLRQQELVDEIRRRVNDYKGEEYDGKYDPIRLVRIIKQVVVIENKTVCGRYKFRDYYDTVMAHESPYFEQQMINFCSHKT